MVNMKYTYAAIIFSFVFVLNLCAQEMDKEYLYVLKLRQDLFDANNWTAKENKIVEEHFNRLKKMLEEGSLVLAGRTLNMDPEGLGIVIFKAGTEEEAKEIAANDPAVKAGIMSAKVFPYRTALIKNFEKEE